MIRKIWNTLVPYNIRNKYRIGNHPLIKKFIIKKKIYELKKYYKNLDNSSLNECIQYMEKTNTIHTFNYNFIEKYHSSQINVTFDDSCGLYYYMYFGKKMYLKRNFSKKEAQEYICGLLIEQDKNSPHKYLSESVILKNKDIIFDIGAAKGNFSLQIIDKVEKCIIFECDEKWIEALNKTFEQYKHKCIIVNSFVGNKRGNHLLVLDDYVKHNSLIPNLIKMDIEGEEVNAIKGLEETINSTNNITLLLCTYHNLEDELQLNKILSSSFEIEMSDGYMIWEGEEGWKPPYFRKGIMRAFKRSLS